MQLPKHKEKNMSKKMIDYLMEKETIVVFDIDGVLAVYEFGDCRPWSRR